MSKRPTPPPTTPEPPASDAELARRACDRASTDRDLAFRQLHARHGRDLLKFVVARADRQADAEALCQEIWIKVHTGLNSNGFDGRNFRGWLFRIAANLITDQHRKTKGKTLTTSLNPIADHNADQEPIDPPDHRAATSQLAQQHEERRAILTHCLESLTSEERWVVDARLACLTNQEIADRANPKVTADRISQLFFRAKRKLTDCVEQARP